MKVVWNSLVFLSVLGLITLTNLLVHEFGHCLTINAVGGICEGIYVIPGVKVCPLTAFGEPYPGTWDNIVGRTSYAQSAPTVQASGLVSVMGSGSVAVLSLLALAGLYIFHPQGWVRFPLLAQSLMFLDLLFYVILPRWFGLRHLFFIGGDSPEPLNGAIKMGIHESTFIAAVLIYSAMMSAGCAGYIRQSTIGQWCAYKIIQSFNRCIWRKQMGRGSVDGR
jgi:hypothetical protein